MLRQLKTLLTDLIGRLRRVLQSSNRDQDVEQSVLRVAVCAVTFGYVWFLVLSQGGLKPGLVMGLAASAADAVVGVWMIWALRREQFHRRPLRYLGAIADNAALTVGMAGAGEGGVAVVGVYLWVTIGNGFRFGPRYLLFSYWLSLVGFGLQLFLVPFWIERWAVGFGLWLALAIVPIYVLFLLNRLTGQKDAAEQLSNAKSRFVANVSHELRTPLTGVFAVYDLLRARKMTPDERELVGMLGSAVKTLKGSVDAVLQMSKLEAGAERAERRPFNLWFLLQQLAAVVKPQSAAKGLAWNLSIDADVRPMVVGDPGHMSHVLGNLLNNAFKFTSAGSVSLRVYPAGQDRVRFEVIDTGIGIPLDQQEHLFERFVQVDNSARRRHGGTGLGTSIARDLTELMGGRIGVVSAPGQGSSFWVELPLPPAEMPPQALDWGALRQVIVIGDASESSEKLGGSLRALGLEPVLCDPALHDAPSFDPQKYLAAILVMSAADAGTYAETVLRDRAGIACPWVVASQSYSLVQRAALVRSGAAALLSGSPQIDVLRLHLGALAFRLEIPSSTGEASNPAGGVVRPLTILLADDNKSNQLLLSRILRDAGHAVRTVGRGDEAFDVMAAGGLDLALLDLNMPDMTGPDVVKLFRASSIGGPKLPIIILSADATPAAKEESVAAGVDEFLTKPVTAPALLGAIERVTAGFDQRGEPELRGPQETRPLPAAAPALVDAERVQALRRIARGDVRFLDAYINAAFADLERALAELSSASATNDVRQAKDALHIIEGTGASLGAIVLVGKCRGMRHYLVAAQDPDRASALAELSTIYALTKSTLVANLHDIRDKTPRSGTVQ
jgi:two-component system, sensor histidine kinase RpfC